LRDITLKHGALLIFDEVMTGFRVHPGGAQAFFEIQPDLTTLGKVIGGGLPVGAYGGKREIMSEVAPAGPVYLNQHGVWQKLENATEKLTEGIGKAAKSAGIPIWQNSLGTMFTTFFNENPVTDWTSAKRSDTEVFSKFFQGMLERGVYIAPSQFEAGFMSSAHGEVEIQATIVAASETFRAW